MSEYKIDILMTDEETQLVQWLQVEKDGISNSIRFIAQTGIGLDKLDQYLNWYSTIYKAYMYTVHTIIYNNGLTNEDVEFNNIFFDFNVNLIKLKEKKR